MDYRELILQRIRLLRDRMKNEISEHIKMSNKFYEKFKQNKDMNLKAKILRFEYYIKVSKGELSGINFCGKTIKTCKDPFSDGKSAIVDMITKTNKELNIAIGRKELMGNHPDSIPNEELIYKFDGMILGLAHGLSMLRTRPEL